MLPHCRLLKNSKYWSPNTKNFIRYLIIGFITHEKMRQNDPSFCANLCQQQLQITWTYLNHHWQRHRFIASKVLYFQVVLCVYSWWMQLLISRFQVQVLVGAAIKIRYLANFLKLDFQIWWNYSGVKILVFGYFPASANTSSTLLKRSFRQSVPCQSPSSPTDSIVDKSQSSENCFGNVAHHIEWWFKPATLIPNWLSHEKGINN